MSDACDMNRKVSDRLSTWYCRRKFQNSFPPSHNFFLLRIYYRLWSQIW